MLALLDDEDLDVAGAAAQRLYLMGRAAEPAVPKLIELALNAPEHGAEPFITGLANMPELSLPRVREVLESATQADAKFQAMLRVVELMGDEAAELAPLLMDLVWSSDSKIGFTLASSALGAVSAGDPEMIQQLLDLAAQADGVPRSAAIDALGYIGPPVGAAAEELWQYTLDESRPVRISALEALESIGYRPEEHVDELVALTGDPDLGPTALRILSTVPAAAEDQLLELFEQSDDAGRMDIYLTLYRGGADPALLVELLLKVMDSDDPVIVYQATRLMRDLGPPAAPAVPRLIELLSTGNDAQIEMAIFTLGFIGPGAEEAVPALEGLAEHAVHGDKARWAIVRITDPENATPLP